VVRNGLREPLKGVSVGTNSRCLLQAPADPDGFGAKGMEELPGTAAVV
jgi:hypothetical protein